MTKQLLTAPFAAPKSIATHKRDKVSWLPVQRPIITTIAAIVLGSSGIAAVMAWAPNSINMRDVGVLPDRAAARAESSAHARVQCDECGVVVSTRKIELPGTLKLFPVADSAPRGGSNDLPGKSVSRYEFTVRMRDGSSRVLLDPNPERWRSGERVIIIDGESQASN